MAHDSFRFAALLVGAGLVLVGCGQGESQAGEPELAPEQVEAVQAPFQAECDGKWQADFVDVPYEAWKEAVEQQPTERGPFVTTICEGSSDNGFGFSVSVLAADSPLVAQARSLALDPQEAAKTRQDSGAVERIVFSHLSAASMGKLQQEVADYVAQAGGSGYTRYAPQRDALEFFGPTPVAEKVTTNFPPADVFANLDALAKFEEQFKVGAKAKGPQVPFYVWLDGPINASGHHSQLRDVQVGDRDICLTWDKEGREELVLLPPDFQFPGEAGDGAGKPRAGVEFLHGPWRQVGPAVCGGKVWPQAVALPG